MEVEQGAVRKQKGKEDSSTTKQNKKQGRSQKSMRKSKSLLSWRVEKERISWKGWSTVLNPRTRLRGMSPQKQEQLPVTPQSYYISKLTSR